MFSKLTIANQYLLRVPALPLRESQLILNEFDKESLSKILLKLYNQPAVKEAILLSSSELHKSISDQLSEHKEITDRTLLSLFKYIIRMSNRCTPYGAFAGIAVGSVVQSLAESKIIIGERTHHNLHYRLDMQYLNSIAEEIENDLQLRQNLIYTANNTLYKQSKQYRFYKRSSTQKTIVTNLSSVTITPTIEKVLQLCEKPITFSDIVSQLSYLGIPKSNAFEFLNKMINNKLLVSELMPTLTGKDYINHLITKLIRVDTQKKYLPTLIEISQLLASKIPLIDRKEKLSKLLNDKFPQIEHKNLLQGDLAVYTPENSLSEADLHPIVEQLNRLAPLSVRSGSDSLKSFKEKFLQKYEGRVVPLLEALDPETGVGYFPKTNSHFLQDKLFQNPNITNKTTKTKKPDIHSYTELVLDKYYEAVQNNKHEILLQDSDLKQIAENRSVSPNLPASSYVIGSLLTDNFDRKKLAFYVTAFGGISGTNLISRFAYLDQNVNNLLEETTNFEQTLEDDVIYAEIIHLPEPRTGNILHRPTFRIAEIPIHGQASENTIQIKLSDLYIFVKNGKITLWSLTHDKEIKPRLSNAHNYLHGVSLYRFLADMQFQEEEAHIRWNWGICANRTFLPRVRYKDIIIARAQWQLKQIKGIDFQSIKHTYKLPEQVLLIENENELLLDLNNPLSIKILIDKLVIGDVTLHENLYNSFDSPVKDTNGDSYSNEIIIPLKREKASFTLKNSPPPLTQLERSFSLGSEWVYVQIECGIQIAEQLLKSHIPLIIQQLDRKNVLDKWFFVRYNSPSDHLRLRIKGKSRCNYKVIVESIYQSLNPLLVEKTINDLKFETYIREIERYTSQLMTDSETFFMMDSEYILELLKNSKLSTERWLYALQNTDSILNNWGYSLSEKLIFCRHMEKQFAEEFSNHKDYNNHFNNFFRSNKKQITNFMEKPNLSIYNEKRNHIITQIADLANCDGNKINFKKDTKEILISSYIHMSINRLFVTDQRKQEYAMYHLLTNYYRLVKGKLKTSSLNYVLDQDIPMRA